MLISLIFLGCDCNPMGSATLECNRTTGACLCQKSSGGPKCDTCARGYTGQWPYCDECGECFQNWDLILQELKGRLTVWEKYDHNFK